MAHIRITGGVLSVESVEGPDAGLPGHDLPGGGHPWLPGHIPPIGGTLPEPPPGVWPPLTPTDPIQPAPPGTPPGVIWPPIGRPPVVGGGPIPPPVVSPAPPGGGGAPPPVVGGGPVPPDASTKPPESKTWWVVVGIPGVGWRYTAIDPSLTIGYPLPPAPAPKG